MLMMARGRCVLAMFRWNAFDSSEQLWACLSGPEDLNVNDSNRLVDCSLKQEVLANVVSASPTLAEGAVRELQK